MKIKVIGKAHSTGNYQGYDYDNTHVYGTSVLPYDINVKGKEEFGYRAIVLKVKSKVFPFNDIIVGDTYDYDINRFNDVVVFRHLE